jgi:hypothetical protein
VLERVLSEAREVVVDKQLGRKQIPVGTDDDSPIAGAEFGAHRLEEVNWIQAVLYNIDAYHKIGPRRPITGLPYEAAINIHSGVTRKSNRFRRGIDAAQAGMWEQVVQREQ